MNLLSIVQSASRRLGLGEPTVVIASSDPRVQQMRGLLEEEGNYLVSAHDWTRLLKEKTFTTTATEIQTGAIPADFDRFVNESGYNRSETRRLVGPLSPQEWQAEKGVLASVLWDAFRVRGTDYIMVPVPEAGQTVAFEYVSNYWIANNPDNNGDVSSFVADSDTVLFDVELLTLGIIWRWLDAKGLDYAEAFRKHEARLMDRKARDGGKRTMRLYSPSPDGARIPYVTEGNWNVP